MDIQRWMARREPYWRQLDTLLRQAERQGIHTLAATELRQLASLYQSVSADLARAQTESNHPDLIEELQSLTTRAFSQVYQGSRRQDWHSIVEFYRSGWPVIVQQTQSYLIIAVALFGLGFAISWWYCWQDPAFLNTVLPPHIIETVRDDGQLWTGSIVGVEPTASSSILVNNLRVAFTTVGGGISAGFFTAFILFFNGLHIGGVAVLVARYNLATEFWAFVSPHGSLELPAIFWAGAAGLLIGRALLFPGYRRRAEALRHYGSQAAQLVYGVIPLLLIAAAIEGFISPNPGIPDVFKYGIGGILFLALMMYSGFRGQP